MSTNELRLDWREGRRRRAWELKQQGWKQQDIAAALGVTAGAVSQLLRRVREQGVEALRRTFGVAYHPAHISRLLHAVRHSVQQPVERAAQRDEAAIQAWWQAR